MEHGESMKKSGGSRLALILLILATSLTASSGCNRGEETEEQERRTADAEEKAEETSQDMAESREAFGLPLPPEVMTVRRDPGRVQVSTRMSMEDLEAFFDSRLVDYEVFRVSNRLEIVPLRPHSARAVARYFTDHRSYIVVDYRPPVDLAELERRRIPRVEPEEESEEEGAPAPRAAARERTQPLGHANEPSWLEDLRGKPVELRTESGELLAPGAVWGEPYIPPEGSPLHTRRNRHNFGRPFGDWIAH